jgi:outer membrane PBP1 activator LpoA protein
MLPRRAETPSPAQLQAEQRARALMLAKDYAGAAQEYLRIEASSPRLSQYGLHAAEAYIEGKHTQEAMAILQRLKIPQNDPNLKPWRDILLARVAFSNNNPAGALLVLDRPYPSDVPTPLQRQIHYYRAEAFRHQDKFLETARELVLLDTLLTNETERRNNRQAIWEAVSHLNDPALAARLASEPSALQGWVELALIANGQIRYPNAFSQSIAAWRARFPDHPAVIDILPTLMETGTVMNRRPRQIALLLPLTGRFAKAAAAISDGFVTAWYGDNFPDRPAVTVYDAGPANITTVYQKAISEGADFVVGPLEKPAVDTLLQSHLLSVPMLALNQASPAALQAHQQTASFKGHHFYQFSLAPEEEANQIAERAWFDGHLRALVLTPSNEWGDRIYRTFKQRWETLGGEVLTHQTYRDNSHDYEAAAKALFNGQGSQAAAAQFGGDANNPSGASLTNDFIFLAAFPGPARQINPHLTIYNAQRLPIYATSHVYSGSEAPEADRDLDGISFGDMPWVLDPHGQSSRFRGIVQRHWPGNHELSRFYAFGVDAYAVLPEIGRLQVQPAAYFDGETGTLRLEEGGRVHRQLRWARFSNGVPRLLEP